MSQNSARNIPLGPNGQSRGALVVIGQPAETRPPPYTADGLDRQRACDQLILEALMIPFSMIVMDELRDGPPEMALSGRNHSVEALFFDGSHKAFRVRIRIRSAFGCPDANPRIVEDTADVPTPLSISIADQYLMRLQEALIGRAQRARHLAHE